MMDFGAQFGRSILLVAFLSVAFVRFRHGAPTPAPDLPNSAEVRFYKAVAFSFFMGACALDAFGQLSGVKVSAVRGVRYAATLLLVAIPGEFWDFDHGFMKEDSNAALIYTAFRFNYNLVHATRELSYIEMHEDFHHHPGAQLFI